MQYRQARHELLHQSIAIFHDNQDKTDTFATLFLPAVTIAIFHLNTQYHQPLFNHRSINESPCDQKRFGFLMALSEIVLMSALDHGHPQLRLYNLGWDLAQGYVRELL